MKHVIFVDDESTLHDLLKLRLRKYANAERIKLYHFLDGDECLKFLREQDIIPEETVIFTDITMPNMDGLTLVKIINEEFPGLTVHLASAMDIDEYKRRAGELKNVQFFPKPLIVDDLLDMIFSS